MYPKERLINSFNTYAIDIIDYKFRENGKIKKEK